MQLVKAQPQNKKRQITSPPLYGGFSSIQPPQRQQRPPKPQPVYTKPSVPSPTYRPVPVTSPSPSVSYDPFNFQVNPTERIDEDIEPSVAPDYSEESTVVPVYLTSEYPQLRRVPKDSSSGGPPPKENEISDR